MASGLPDCVGVGSRGSQRGGNRTGTGGRTDRSSDDENRADFFTGECASACKGKENYKKRSPVLPQYSLEIGTRRHVVVCPTASAPVAGAAPWELGDRGRKGESAGADTTSTPTNSPTAAIIEVTFPGGHRLHHRISDTGQH